MPDATGPMLDPKFLYSDRVTKPLLKSIDEGFQRRYKKQAQALELRDKAARMRLDALAGLGSDDKTDGAQKALLDLFSTPQELPPARAMSKPVEPPTIPTTNSCVFLQGSYIQWRTEAVSTGGQLSHFGLGDPNVFSTLVQTDSPRLVHAREVIGGGLGTAARMVVGTTSWVRLGRSGPATMTAEIFLNAHDNVFSYLIGDAEGRITVGGLVQQLIVTNETVRVGSISIPIIVQIHEGSSSTQLADLSYIGFESWEMERATVQATFPGEAHALYACSAWVEVFAMAWMAAVANVEIAAIVDPIEVCQ